MIITKSEPYTKGEIEKLREKFDSFLKTVIDINQKICSAGMDRHFEGEPILLEGGSKESDKIAARFYGEAIERINELDNQSIKPYLRKHIQSVINLKNQKDIRKKAEDALMYSTIVQNYCLKYC